MKKQPTQEQANSALECILGQKTVGFYPVIAKALGSAPAAIMVSQAFFWQYKAKFGSPVVIDGDQYFSKTVTEWYDETSVTESAQRLARSILVKHGIMVEKLAGLPATMHFRVDINALVAVINGYLTNGITVAAKHGNRKPQVARTGSGKFRQQEAIKDGKIYIESSESSESVGEVERFAPPAPAESETLKAEEVKRGVVAPPAEAAAPTHTVTTIDPEEPHTRVVNPFVMPRRVETVDEAEEIIMEWAKSEGRESVRKWYADAARQCTAVDVTAMVAKFAGVYLTIGDEGKRQRMAQDPLQFFKYTFKSFLKTEKSFSAKVMPGPSTQKAPPANYQTSTRY